MIRNADPALDDVQHFGNQTRRRNDGGCPSATYGPNIRISANQAYMGRARRRPASRSPAGLRARHDARRRRRRDDRCADRGDEGSSRHPRIIGTDGRSNAPPPAPRGAPRPHRPPRPANRQPLQPRRLARAAAGCRPQLATRFPAIAPTPRTRLRRVDVVFTVVPTRSPCRPGARPDVARIAGLEGQSAATPVMSSVRCRCRSRDQRTIVGFSRPNVEPVAAVGAVCYQSPAGICTVALRRAPSSGRVDLHHGARPLRGVAMTVRVRYRRNVE